MRVFVTGGTGAIGRHAVPALVAAGHTVSALARTPDRAVALEAQGARPVAVSLFDRDGLALAFERHEAVVNLATAIPPTSRFLRRSAWADSQHIRTEGSAAVVDAALAAAVGVTPWVRPPGRAALLLGERTSSLTRSLRVTNRRFREATDWAPRYPSAREGLAATARDT